jgi:antitoxin VapB
MMADSGMSKMKSKVYSEQTEAKLFWNGRSQAVRLPKGFRFEGDRVHIRRVDGGVLLEQVPTQRTRVEALLANFANIDKNLGDTPFPERESQPPAPIREYFD